MFEPIRGGTRGGQGEFKWSDVSADKDREHYLGHSVNAPAGRWQKNKDIHWYNRDLKDGQAERDEELRRIKEMEADALAVALGYEPSSKTNANAIPVAGSSAFNTEAEEGDKADSHDKEERRRLKDEKRAEKRARKELKRLSQSGAHTLDDLDRRSRRNRSRSRSPRYRSRERRSGEERRLRSRSRSRTPLGQRRSRKVNDDRYDAQSRDRDADRRRWDGDSRRDKPSDRRN